MSHAKGRAMILTTGYALMAISLIFMFVVVAAPNAIGLDVIVSSYAFYTQRAVVNNPLIGITNQGLPSGATSTPWYSPTNAGRIDQQYASTGTSVTHDAAPGSITSHVVSSLLTTFLYNFTIPVDAQPTGLIVQVVGHYICIGPSSSQVSSTCTVKDNLVQLVAYGKLSGTPHASGSLWPASYDSAITYGGSLDSWGLTLTQDMIMAPDFGVAISTDVTTTLNVCCSSTYPPFTASVVAYVDMISMTLIYKVPVYVTTTYATTVGSSTQTLTSVSTSINPTVTQTVTNTYVTTSAVTSTATSVIATTPSTVTNTYTPTTYTWTQPGGTTTMTTTQGGSQSTVTLSTTSVSRSLLQSFTGLQTNQAYALAGSLMTFLTGFGMSLFGIRKR